MVSKRVLGSSKRKKKGSSIEVSLLNRSNIAILQTHGIASIEKSSVNKCQV